MRQKLNTIYRKAAEEFARRVTASLGGQVDSLVLYGSVARGKAKRDSDIDLLVISQNPKMTRERVSEIRCDFTEEQDFSVFISLVDFSGEEFYKLVDLGSPFVRDVLEDGVILYDNGTFARVREKAVAVSR